MTVANTAGHLEQLSERCTERNLEVARTIYVARDREYLEPSVVGLAELKEVLRAVLQDVRHRGERLGVINGGRPAEQAKVRRERRLIARQATLALERLEQ